MLLTCPHCESKTVRRSQRKGIFEAFVLKLTPLRPFRCRDCSHRFYRMISNVNSIESKNSVAGQASQHGEARS